MIFQFKQFAVDQAGCAMKINTDGVLLGAIAEHHRPKHVLDIGTGTGVIALMLAQRYHLAQIDAIEIDVDAAATAGRNFAVSPFNKQLACYPLGFKEFFDLNSSIHYDIIISNPPFYINSLKSPGRSKAVAKHADEEFFSSLISRTAQQLTPNGLLWLILPPETAHVVFDLAEKAGLKLTRCIEVSSFTGMEPHRFIVAFSATESYLSTDKLTIYQEPKIYTEAYKALLHNFFTIF